MEISTNQIGKDILELIIGDDQVTLKIDLANFNGKIDEFIYDQLKQVVSDIEEYKSNQKK